MSNNPVSIVLVGVGGYGNTYVNALLDAKDKTLFRIAGVVDPFATGCRRLEELKALGIPFFDDLGAFYAENSAELAVISSPISLHAPQTCKALENGSNVLCEKPLGATIQEATAMREARDRAKRFVAIGYQWSFNEAILALKRDILAGRFGAPKRLRTLVLWPRSEAYYKRNSWAAALKDARGNWVLDSPVNNATAHYLHNMFYVLGPAINRSAVPRYVTAELYRANRIENYDTGACRVLTEDGVEILFYSCHAVSDSRGPEFVYEFENGVVTYSALEKTIQAAFASGETVEYGDPQRNVPQKLWDSVGAVRGKNDIMCGVETASSQTLCMNGMQESASGITEFPASLVSIEGEGDTKLTVVEGLADTLAHCYETGCLPAETDAPWATAGRVLDLRGYSSFPSFS